MGFMCLFCIVMILLLYLFQVVFLEQFYKTVKYNEIKTSTTVIEKNLDNDELETLMARISQENDICIGLYTNLTYSGTVLYTICRVTCFSDTMTKLWARAEEAFR